MQRVILGRIAAGEVIIGVPLAYSAYDQNHSLLLREGVTLSNQRQLDALLERGLYRVVRIDSASVDLPADDRPLERFDQLCQELNSLLLRAEGDDFEVCVLSLAARLGRLCEKHAEACLAGVLHDQRSRYAVRHMVHVAIVALRVASALDLDESERLSLTAAALTMNLAILDLQNTLHTATDRDLSVAHRQAIRRHPQTTVAQLVGLGVTDARWLQIVSEHHEAYDGSGYPGTLAGEAILLPARILGIADSYTARLRQRADRDAMLPNKSLRAIFVGGGSRYDPKLVAILAKSVGMFPPGLVVELENGELAVVTRLGESVHAPVVSVVVTAQGELLRQSTAHRSAVAPYRIRHALGLAGGRYRFDPLQFWRGR